MAIPYRTGSLETVPEAYRDLYVEKREGEKVFYVATVDGVSPKEVVDDFRNNNLSLIEQVRSLGEITKRWNEVGEDPEQVKTELAQLREIHEKVKNKELVAQEGFKTALESKTQAFKDEMTGRLTQMEKKLQEAEREAEKAKNELRQHKLDTEIQAASVEVGVRAKAMIDVRSRAVLAGWTLNDEGQPVLRGKEGIIERGRDGYPLTIREWLQTTLYEAADHMFEKGTGGGSPGHISSNLSGLQKYGGVNPWDEKHRNITMRQRILEEDPQLAAQLRAQVGFRGAL